MLAATLTRTRAIVLALILLSLILWTALLVLSFPSIHAPSAIMPGLIMLGLPVFVLLGIELRRQGSLGSRALAYRDDLTDLGNRRAFRALTQERLHDAKSGSLAIIMIDVNQLKTVNDECGHQAGDAGADDRQLPGPDSRAGSLVAGRPVPREGQPGLVRHRSDRRQDSPGDG